jgi:hypothetical protein
VSTPHPLILAGWIVADVTATVEVIATVLLTAGAIGLGVAVFVWVRGWRRRLDEEPTIEAHIESYRNMLHEGLIDQAEFERIQGRLEGRADAPTTGIQPGPLPQPTQPTQPTQPPQPTDLQPGLPPRPTDLRPGPQPTQPTQPTQPPQPTDLQPGLPPRPTDLRPGHPPPDTAP